MMNIEQLLQRAGQITVSGLPFMEGKEKLEVSLRAKTLNEILTVDEYGYLEGDEGEYVVISLQEYPKNFIYGSSVVTEAFKKFDSQFNEEERTMILEHGLTFRLEECMSKNKRKYTKITFFPKN